MTNHENFIDRLNKNEILPSEESLITSIELTKDIPLTYLPVLGANLDYYKYGTLKTIYDYLSKSQIEKGRIRNLGSARIGVLDYAADFVLNHLNERIELCKKNNSVVVSGTLLLDESLEEKEKLVIEMIPDIYHFLSRFGTDYIFSGSKRTDYLDYLCSDVDLDRQTKLVEILARYSSLEDLQDYNIMSFQKFIKM